MGIQLYDVQHQPLYPNTNGESVITSAVPTSTNVDEALRFLNDKISELTGEKDAVIAINVTVTYARTKIKELEELKANISTISWDSVYTTPDAEYPYTWKKTVISVAETSKEFYEIVASDTSDSTQNIYLALDTGTQPVIVYPKKIVNGEETEEDDLTAFDYYLPGANINDTVNNDWSETPQSISAQQPYLYMSTRKRVDGLWGRYTAPALLGKWAFDSKIELRYTVTDITTNKNDIEITQDINPGTHWSQQTPDSYTGKLWMITATSVNGVLNRDNQDIIWDGPHLLSIIQ